MKADWVAEVFAAARDCGEDISIVYGGSCSTTHGQPQWFELPHDRYDGVSGLASLLREQGCRVDKLPVWRAERFTFLRGVLGLFAVVPTLRIRRREWLQFDGTRRVSFRPVKERVAWQLLTEEQTLLIIAAARSAGVTVNTYVLFHLDAAVADQLMPAAAGRRWMIPVNLRGAVRRRTENCPQMSFLAVDMDRGVSLTELQTQISRLKKKGYHWGSWLALHIGRLIGAAGMRRDILSKERQQHGWTGIFSNLGVWEVPDAGSWIFCPAIWRAQPVGAGCLTMNGRMALAIQLHDGFGTDLQAAHALLKAWLRACLPQPVQRADAELCLGTTG